MYWPVGIPSWYAQSKERKQSLDDGLNGPDGSDGGAEDAPRRDEAEVQAAPTTREKILGIKVSRGGQLFATFTSSTLGIWQTKPLVLLATAARSARSLKAYGDNVGLMIRPDALIIVVQTSDDFLITYSLASDPNAQVYNLSVRMSASSRRQSADGIRKSNVVGPEYGPGDGSGIRDISIRFRMVIRIDAGISSATALDDELMVATRHPAAIQCVRWSPDESGSSHSTELLKRLTWFSRGVEVTNTIYDRPMGLYVWLSSDGEAYAVQGTRYTTPGGTAYQGFCFHKPGSEAARATQVAVNARFSLIAVGRQDAVVDVYAAKDYRGNIPQSHTLQSPVPRSTSGGIVFITHSPDGYCTFVGYEKGWAMWSFYGKPGANSFAAEETDQWWLKGMTSAFWAGQGAELILSSAEHDQICVINMARGAVTGCFAMSNISNSLLQSSDSLMLSRGHDELSASSLSTITSRRETIQYPSSYVSRQWPVRCSVISPDGKYIAIAGRRGLAHYSTASHRWKTYDDAYEEDEMMVRGGMCWYQHILVAAVDCDGQHQIRLISREKSLGSSSAMHVETLQHPVIHMTLLEDGSLLVYTHENVLLHFMLQATLKTIRLVQVGQIGFHGIIRAPTRVRSVTWVVPDEHCEHGEAAQDVSHAAVFFLIDGKLVLLQPSPEENRELKYDMRVIAHDVEYFILAREVEASARPPGDARQHSEIGSSLSDSLWYFNGTSMRVWPDVHDLIASTSSELSTATATCVEIPVDFYPLTPLLPAGTLTGVETELIHRRDADMSFASLATRNHLFIPPILSHHLSRYDEAAALHLSDNYGHLPYFSHALEVLLHDTLDDEVDAPATNADGTASESKLAQLLPFLSSFPDHVEIILGCARKTELRSWDTLFAHAPPVATLFDEAMRRGRLKTAGGLLLVLHTFDEARFTAAMMGRLLRAAGGEGEWELCRELARFLLGIDGDGHMLAEALAEAGMTR